jgi:hypothetical protein
VHTCTSPLRVPGRRAPPHKTPSETHSSKHTQEHWHHGSTLSEGNDRLAAACSLATHACDATAGNADRGHERVTELRSHKRVRVRSSRQEVGVGGSRRGRLTQARPSALFAAGGGRGRPRWSDHLPARRPSPPRQDRARRCPCNMRERSASGACVPSRARWRGSSAD